MSREEWITHLKKQVEKEKIKENEPMCEHTSFQIGGPAAVFIKVDTRKELGKIVSCLNTHRIPYFILGNGSNLLVSDEGYDGVILSLGQEFEQIEITGHRMKAGAAVLLEKASEAAMEASLSGLEFAAGIPGSVGGGVVMNAGAYGGELSQIVAGVYSMSETGEIIYLDKEALELGYRTSIFKKKPYIALEIVLELKPGEQEAIRSQMEEYNQQRAQKQPLEYPSAGSTFKRPEGYFAGKLIMDAGLRGFSVGGAQVSEKHCGFVINKNGATARDICGLMREVQRRVKAQFGVELEPEVIFLGHSEEGQL